MPLRGSIKSVSSRGTVSLVALCFVAVLGISLAGYISVCSRAMTLSNRSFQGNLSQQLAELGIEEALRAFNKNDWSDWSNGGYSADWTLDTTNKRATATVSFPTGKFGQGATATVKIRVDNYDAAHLGATWSPATTYRIGDLVGYNGIWYRSVQNNNSNRTPGDLAWWVQSPIPWAWSGNITYAQYDVVNYNGTWYRSTTNSNTSTPPTNWATIPSVSLAWNSTTSYAVDSFVYYSGTWYRSVTSNTNSAPPNSNWSTAAPYISWAWRYSPSESYQYNDVVYYGGKWWRCLTNYTSNNWWEYPGSSWISGYWEDALSGTNTTSSPGPQGWSSSSINYNLWDAVYYSGQWYRCIKAHASSGSITPASTVYWTNTPPLSTAWDSGKQYGLNDTVLYNGTWYISISGGPSNVAQNPATTTGSWIGANTSDTSHTWNSTTNYTTGNYRCYGGVWYRCTSSHTNKSPNDTSYWSAATAPVVYAEATVSIANSPPAKTQLRAPISPAPLFPNAVGATTDLTITTGTGTVDSYDSSVGAYGGTNVTYSAVLAAGSTLAINGTTAVKGYLAWPFGATASGISTGTTVKGASSAASPNVDTSRVSRSPSIPQFDTLPIGGLTAAFTSASLPRGALLASNPSGTVSIGTPGATTPSRFYYGSDLSISSSGSYDMATLKINGPVILYVNGNLRLESGGSGLIDIASTGSAEIHYKLIFRTYSGSHGIRNRTLDPKKLILINDSTSSNQTFLDNGSSGTNKDFYGVIYAPNITTSTGLDIRSGINLYGAISSKKVTFSSEANVHYDTSLRYATFGGVDQPYAVTEWRELPVTEQATMP